MHAQFKTLKTALLALSLFGGYLGSAFGADPATKGDGANALAALRMEFVRVPGGCYQMGSHTGEKHERPVHKVCVSEFELGKYEVTQAQWHSLMGTNPSRHATCGDTCPVENVSWNQAQEFIAALNERKIGKFRLPTEAEWEYACRDAGKDQVYAGEADAGSLDQIAWFKRHGPKISHPVGGKRANALGLYDMSGNVWEWVQDQFATPYLTDLPELDPVVTGTVTERVLRGGSFDGRENYVRCAIRNRNNPDRQDYRLGFRLVREIAKR